MLKFVKHGNTKVTSKWLQNETYPDFDVEAAELPSFVYKQPRNKNYKHDDNIDPKPNCKKGKGMEWESWDNLLRLH